MSCPDCFKGAIHDHATPQGSFQTLYGYRTYVTGLNGSNASRATILYLPDAFGLRLINNKLLADRYAQDTGCRVLLPDIIPGGGASVHLLNLVDTITKPAGFNPIAWVWRILAVFRAIASFVPFLIKANAPKVYPAILKYARAIRADLEPQGKLGVCGFCWGGYGATLLCTETVSETDSTGKNLIDAAFTAHPSSLKTPNMFVNAISHQVPYSCAVAEFDQMVNAKVAQQAEAAVREKVGGPDQNNYEFVIHKGCSHGFAVRAHEDNKLEVEGCESAAKQAADWFNRFLN